MLSYRAANVRDREKWAAILDEGFVFTLPITPYRYLERQWLYQHLLRIHRSRTNSLLIVIRYSMNAKRNYSTVTTIFLSLRIFLWNHYALMELCRSFHKSDIVSSSRVIVGVDAAIADAASLALMVESVGLGTDQWKNAVKRFWNASELYFCIKADHLHQTIMISSTSILSASAFLPVI